MRQGHSAAVHEHTKSVPQRPHDEVNEAALRLGEVVDVGVFPSVAQWRDWQSALRLGLALAVELRQGVDAISQAQSHAYPQSKPPGSVHAPPRESSSTR